MRYRNYTVQDTGIVYKVGRKEVRLLKTFYNAMGKCPLVEEFDQDDGFSFSQRAAILIAALGSCSDDPELWVRRSSKNGLWAAGTLTVPGSEVVFEIFDGDPDLLDEDEDE